MSMSLGVGTAAIGFKYKRMAAHNLEVLGGFESTWTTLPIGKI